MRRVKFVAGWVVAALVATTVGSEHPAAAVDGRPVEPAREVAVRLGGDGETLVVGWELWRGAPGAYEGIDEWVVTAPGADEVVVPATAVRAEIEGLDVEETHVVTVTGRNGEGDGPPATGTFDPALTPPGAVGELDVRPTAIAGQLLVSWTAPVSDPVVDDVRITWPGGHEDVLATEPQGITIGSMTDGQPVVVTARARSADGWGPVAPAPPMASGTPILAPPEVTAEPTGQPGEIEVTWGAPTAGAEGLSPIDGFEVTWSGGGRLTVPGATSRTTTLTGLVDGEAYDVRVASRNGAGPGVRAMVADVVPSGPPTAAPAGLTAEATGTSGEVQLDWADFDAAGDGGSDVTAFRIEGAGAPFDVTTPEQALIEDLPDGEPVELSVRAVNANGVGPPASAGATPSGPPTAAPEWIWHRVLPGAGRLRVGWPAVTGAATGGSPITGYEIEAGPVTHTAPGDATEADISGLTDGEATTTRIRALNANGPGPWRSGGDVTTGIPIGPIDLTVRTIGDTAARVTWNPLPTEEQGTGPVDAYRVAWYDPSWQHHAVDLDATDDELLIEDLVPGAAYGLVVSARNEHGWGAHQSQQIVAGRPSVAPAAIVVEPTGNADEVEVSWTVPAEGVGTATGVVVRHTGTGTEVEVPVSSSSAVVGGLQPWGRNEFHVWFRSAHGDGPWSPLTEHVRASTPPPHPPTVQVAPRPGALDVSWQGVWDDGGSPLTGYEVSWESASGSGSEVVGPETAAFTIEDLPDGEAVSVTVAGVNRHGAGAASEPIVRAPGQLPDALPGPLTVEPTGQPGQVEVSWSGLQAEQWGTGTTREYLVTWGEESVRVPAGTTTHVIGGLAVDTSLLVTVRAVTEVGPSTELGEWVWVGSPPTQPPTGVVARPGAVPGRAVVEWNPSGKRFEALPSYGWVVTWTGGSRSLASTVNRVELTGLPTDVPLTFQVQARSPYGLGPASPPTRPIRADGVAPRPNLLGTADVGEHNGLGWVGMGAELSRSDEVAESGRASLRVELARSGVDGPMAIAEGGNGGAPVTPGQEYVASVWVQATRAEGTRGAMASVAWFGADGQVVGEADGDFVEDLGGTWTELATTVVAPEGAVRGVLFVMFAAGDETDVFHLDGAVLATTEAGAPNLLTEVQSGFETGSLGWTASYGRTGRSDDVGGHGGWTSLRVELDGRHDAGAGEAASVSADPVALGELGADRTVAGAGWARTRGGASEASASLTFLDAAGAVLDTVTGTPVAIGPSGWTKATVSTPAPAGATHVIVSMVLPGAADDVRHVDDVAVRVGPSATPGPNLLAAATAGFESDDLGWLGSDSTIGASVDPGRHGMVSMTITGRGSAGATTDLGTAGVPVTPHHQYTASAWAMGWETTRATRTRITWYDATGALLDDAVGEPVTEAEDDWRQAWVTAVAPPGAAFASMAVTFAGATSGEVHSLDDVAFCRGSSPDCLADTPPAVRPGGVVIADDGAGEVLTWTLDPADRAAEGVTGYLVTWDGGEIEVADPVATSAVLDGVDPEVRTVSVAAVNAHGVGPEAHGTRPGPPTAAPGELFAAGTGENGEIEIDWAAVDPEDDGGSPIIGYRVQAEGMTWYQDVTATETRFGNFPDGAPVTITVWARNAFGLGPAATARATPYGAPLPLYGITARATGAAGQVQVTWTPRAEPAGATPVTGYEVRVGDQRSVEAPEARSLLVDGLADGAQVQVVVRAVNEHGPGPWSRASTVPGVPAGAVADLRTESVSTTAQRVRWTPVPEAQQGAGPITRQIVRRQTLTYGYYLGAATDVEVAPGTGELAMDGLTAGQGYRVTVWSVNAHGASPAVTVDFVAGRPTSRPTGVTTNATGQPGQAEVSWNLPTEGLGAATGIVVTRQWGDSVVLPLDATSTVLTGLSDGYSTYISVALRSPHGDGPAWGPVSVVTGGPPIGAPSGVWVEPAGSGLEVDWSQVYATGGSPLTGYLVTWESSTGSGQQLVPPSPLRHLIPDLDDDVEWSVTVRAVNQWGEGPASAPAVGRPGIPPGGSPTTMTALPTGVPGEFLVSWDPLPESAWGSGDDRRYAVGVSWPDPMAEVPGDQTSVVVSGIPPGGRFLYLWARTDVGDGHAYAHVEAIRGHVPRIGAVDVVARPTGTPGRATVEWSTQYPLHFMPPGEVTSWVVAWSGGSVEVPAEARTATIEGLSPTAPVTFTVRAKNVEGLGPAAPANRPIVPDGSARRPDLLPPSRLNVSPLGWATPQALLSRSGEQAESGRSSLRMELRADEVQVLASGDTGGLPVSGGETYAMSTWMRAEEGETLDALIGFAWLDAAGSFLAQPEPDGWTAVGDEWTEVSSSVTAPATAATLVPFVGVEATKGMVVHLDGAVVALDDPAAPNLLSEAHSGFEHGALGWTTRGTRISRSSAVGGHEGLTALRVELDGRTIEGLASVGTDPLALPALAPDRLVSGSLWVRAPEGGQARPTLAFLDADGVVLDTTLGSVATAGDAWSELAISAAAPAGAATVVVGAAFDGAAGAVRYLDDVVIGPGAAPTASSNLLLPAPSGFETDGLGWFGQRGRVGVDFMLARDGFLAMSIEATGRGPAATTDLGTAGVPVQADRQYSASVWIFKVDGSDRSARATITWYDATGARLGESPGDEVVGDDGWWTEVSVTALAPPGAAFASLAVSFPDARAGEFFGVDDPSFCGGPDVDCQPQTAPGVKVSGLTAVAGPTPGTVDVSWTLDPAVRAEERVTGFDIRWDDGIEQVEDPAATSVTLSGLSGAGPLELQVRASNGHGLGPVATTTVDVDLPDAPPEAPQGVMAVPSPGGIDVTWAPPGPSAGTITGYVVRYAPGWDMTVDVPATATGVTVPSWDGVAQISVAARNSHGRGPASPVQLVDGGADCPAPDRSGHAQVVLADEPAAFYTGPGYDPDTWEAFVSDEVTCTRGEREPAAGGTHNPQLGSSDAFQAAGRGGRIVLPLDGVTDDLASVEMWVDGGGPLEVEVPGGRLRLAGGRDPDDVQVVPADGQWHHLVLTAAGDELHATVDGEAVLVGDEPWAITWDPDQQEQGVIRLVEGGFDQIALYTEPLSGAAIARHRAAAGLQETWTTLAVPAGEPSATVPTTVVARVTSDGDTPTGDAVLLANGVEIARQALDLNGHAALSAVLGTGNLDLVAVFEGSPTHVGSRSSRSLRTVGGDVTVTELELGAATGPYGSSTTVDVTVTDADAQPVAGPVEVWVDGRLHRSMAADGSGEATATLPALIPGAHVVTAVHRGTTGLRPSMATTRWTVTPAEVEPESTPGELEFTLPAVDGGAPPTGWVTVALDGDQVGSAYLDPAIDAAGRVVSEARLTTAAIRAEAGSHPLEVVYSGDRRYRPTTWDHPYEVEHTVMLTGPETAEIGVSVPVTAHVRTNGLPASGWGDLLVDGEPYSGATASDGVADGAFWRTQAGAYEVSFRYNGTESTPIEIVVGQATRVEVSTSEPARGSPLEGSVARATGTGAVDQGWVSVGPSADGSEPERVPVNSWGGFSLPTDHLAPGSEVRVTYTPAAPTPTPAQPFLGSRSEPVTVARTPAVIEVAGIPSGVVDGTTLSVEVTVTAGAPAQGEVTASWGGGDPVASGGLDIDGRATFEVTVPGPGLHQLRLDYLGSTVAAPEVLEVPVNVHDVVEPSVRIVADPSASTDVGADLDVTVIVTNPPSINASRPTGDVELTVDGVVVGTTSVEAGAAGQAEAVFDLGPSSGLGALGRRGPHVLRARYLGDDLHRPSRAEIGIRRTEPVTVTIVDPPATSPYWNPPTLEVTVEAADGTVPRGGELLLWVASAGHDGYPSYRAPVAQDGTTTITMGDPPGLGRHDLRVTYTGDDTFRHASSAELDHLVTAAPTTVVLTSPTSPVTARGPLVLRAAVSTPPTPFGSHSPYGQVTFRAGSTVLGTASTGGGVATLTTTAPATAGPTTFTATYGGHAYYSPSTGSVELAVADAVTTTTVSPQERPAEIGEAVELLATVKAGPDVIADVPVVFSEGTTTLGTATTDEDGIARLEVQLPAGPHQIRATFAGAPSLAPSAATALTYWVARRTTMTVTSLTGSLTYGQAARYRVAVAYETGGGYPTGQVRLESGTKLGLWVPLGVDGTAEVSMKLGTGRWSAKVAYSGTNQVPPSTSEPFDVIVARAVLEQRPLTVQPPQVVWGSPITVSARVVPIAGVPVTGDMTLHDTDGTQIGYRQRVSDAGQARFTVARRDLDVGVHHLTARYAGTPDYAPSESASFPVTVSVAHPVIDVNAPTALRDEGVAEIDLRVASPGEINAQGDVELWSVPTSGPGTLLDTETLDDKGEARFLCSAAGASTTHPCGGLASGTHRFKIVFPQSWEGIAAGESDVFSIVVQPASAAEVTWRSPPVIGYTGRFVSVAVDVEGPGERIPEGTVTILGPGGLALGTNGVDEDGIATVRFTAETPGDLELVASYSGDEILGPQLSAPHTIEIRESIAIVMTTPARTFVAGSTSDVVTLELRRPDGSPYVAPAGGVPLDLGSSSRSTVFASPQQVDTDTVLVPAGQSSVSLTLENTSANAHQLTARSEPLGVTVWQQFPFTVTRAAQAYIVPVPATVSAAVGQPARRIRVVASDAYGNSHGDLTSGVTFTTPGGTCTTDGVCTPTVPGDHTVTITHGSFTTSVELHANTPPTAEIVGAPTPSPTNPRRLTFTLRAGDADGDALTWVVHWGDGTGSTQVLSVSDQPKAPDGTWTVTHDFAAHTTAEVVFQVTDSKALAYDSERVVKVEDLTPVADAGDDQVAQVATEVAFDGSNSRPRTETLRYRWDFGDGSEDSTEQAPSHVYEQPGQYLVTLVVAHGTTMSTASTAVVTVTGATGSGVFVDVLHNGQPVPGAAVVVNTADDIAHRGVAQPGNAGRYVLAGLPLGQHTAYVYRDGFAPAAVGFVVTGGVDTLSVDLVPGAAARATLTTRRLSHTEAVELGIITQNTDAEVIHQFDVWLPNRSRPVTLYQDARGQSLCPSDPDEDLIDDETGEPLPQPVGEDCGELLIPDMGGGGGSLRMKGNTVVVMNKTRATWAKEVFAATLQVFNISPDGFTLVNGVATLNLPGHGLALAEMVTGEQSAVVGLNSIAAGQSQTVNWYLRGDAEGYYDLSADITAVLDPVGVPISVRAETDDENRIHVWGTSAVQASLETDATVEADAPFRQRVTVTNVADVPIYNVLVGLDTGRPNGHVEVLAQPRQADAVHVGELSATETVRSPEARLLFSAEQVAEGNRLDSYQSVDTSVGPVGFTVSRHDDLERLPAPVIVPGEGGTALDGATLSWEPVDGALGYAVFTTSSRTRAFPADPIAATDDGEDTSVVLPPQGGYGVVAVTALVDRKGPGTADDVYAMSHRLLEAGTLAPEPDPHGVRLDDPCRGFGTDPTVAYPGNFALGRTDLVVPSIGLPLAIRRTYNSFDPRDGGGGAGWNVDLGPRLVSDQDGNAALIVGDGSCRPVRESPETPGTLEVFGRSERWQAEVVPGSGGQIRLTDLTARITYRLDAEGRTVWAENPQGHRTLYDYEAEATRPDTITDESSGRALHLTWTDDDRLRAVATDPVTPAPGQPAAPIEWIYHHDTEGRLALACAPGAACELYQYDTDGRVRTVVDREHTVTTVVYDDQGRLLRLSRPASGMTSYAYAGDGGRQVTTTDARGAVTVASFDETYRLTTAEGPDGEAAIGYDAHGFVGSVTAKGQDVTMTSNQNGVPLSMASSLGTTTYGHDARGNISTVTGPRGLGSTTVYDTSDRPTSRTIPATSLAPALTTSWSYSAQGPDRTRTTPAIGGGTVPWGLVIEEREPVPAGWATSAGVTSYGYDAQGNAVRTELPTGAVLTATYDELGRRTSHTTTAPGLPTATTTYTYDDRGDVLTSTGPATTDAVTGEAHQVRTTTTYDRERRPTKVVEDDIAGSTPTRQRSVTYDGRGRVLTESVQIDASRAAVTRHRYDAAGNEVETVDAEGTVTRRTFDLAGRTLTEQVDGVVVATIAYDPETGQVTQTTDALNRTTAYIYDDAGRLVHRVRKAVDLGTGTASDVVLEHRTYDSDGDLATRILDGGLRRTNYTYDAVGRLASEVYDPAGVNRTTEYRYDAAGNQSAVRRTGGSATEEVATVHDGYGRVVEQIVDNGSTDLVTTITYDALGRVKTQTDPEGNVTSTAHDVLGQVVSSVGAAVPVEGETGLVAPTTTYGRDAFGQATTVRDPEGRESTSEYNGAGWLVATTRPDYDRSSGGTLVATTEYDHDLLGRVVRTTAPGGGVSETDYDGRGRVTSATTPGPSGAPATTTNTYDGLGRLTGTVSPTGLSTTTTYDGLDRAISVTQVVPGVDGQPARELTTTMAYDLGGNVVRTIDPEGGVTTSTYNRAGEVLTRVSPWQNQLGTAVPVTYQRDGLGRTVEIADEVGGRTGTQRDAAGRVTAEGVHDGTAWQWTTLALDGNGNVETRTSPEGRVTAYDHDALGRLTSVTQTPGGSAAPITTTYGYDRVGNQVRVTNGRGHSTTIGYNAWDLPEAVVEPSTDAHPDAADRTWTTEYDLDGREVLRTEPGGITVTSTYDAAGNLVSEQGTSVDEAVPDATRTLTYDIGGRVVTAGVPGGTAAYGYDARGLQVSQTGAGGTVDHLRYDGVGRLVERADDRGLATFTYGDGGRLEAMTDPVSGRDFTYTYDAAGRRTGQVATTPDFAPGPEGTGDRETTNWEYDAVGRQVGLDVLGPDGELRRGETTTYDADGNRTGRTVVDPASPTPVPETFTYDGAGRVASFTDEWNEEPVPLTWDAAGNMVGIEGAGFAYDERNRVVEVLEDGTANTGIVSTARGDRTRLEARGEPEEGSEPWPGLDFAYDALGRQVSAADVTYEWDSRGRVATRTAEGRTDTFTYVGGDLDPASAGDAQRGTGPDGEVVSVDDEVVTVDGHHDIVSATTPDGTTTNSGYALWGDPRTGSPGAGPFGFQGDYHDPAVGTVLMGARVYHPFLGSFSSRDTYAGDPTDPVTLNRYTYGNADPVNHWDPDGHRSSPITYQEVTLASQVLAGVMPILTAFVSLARAHPIISALGVAGAMIVAAEALAIILGYRYQGFNEMSSGTEPEPPVVLEPSEPLREPIGSPCTTPGGGRGVVDGLGNCNPVGEVDPGVDPEPPPGLEPEPGGSGAGACRNAPQGEVFYRGMNDEELRQHEAGHGVQPRGESFVTQSLDYVRQLAARHPAKYPNIVRFDMAPGTVDALLGAGARSPSRQLVDAGYGHLPLIEEGMTDAVHVKWELGAVNYGLRSGSAHLFNDRIKGWCLE